MSSTVYLVYVVDALQALRSAANIDIEADPKLFALGSIGEVDDVKAALRNALRADAVGVNRWTVTFKVNGTLVLAQVSFDDDGDANVHGLEEQK